MRRFSFYAMKVPPSPPSLSAGQRGNRHLRGAIIASSAKTAREDLLSSAG